ncbi:MAG: hypothetical protein V1793_24275 [Pseudomonadota bacterium]
MDTISSSGPSAWHRWRFVRSGGFDQVLLDSGDDLKNLDFLDQKLWVALSCPTRGLEFDIKTLDMIDTDKDGRIRVPEILAAVRWTCSVLKDPGVLFSQSSDLKLSAIDDGTKEGARLIASAGQILSNLGKGAADSLSLDDVSDSSRIFSNTKFNGDGVIPVDAAEDDATRSVLADIIACFGAEKDRCGADGVSETKLKDFFQALQAYADWLDLARKDKENILPLGEATSGTAATFKALKAKVDDYFSRCRMAAYDSRSTLQLNGDAVEYASFAKQELSANGQEIADFPLAMIEAGKPLPLVDGLNPAWIAGIGKLQKEIIQPLMGLKQELTFDEWKVLSGRFSAHEAWQAVKSGMEVERLGEERVRAILAGDRRAAIEHLIAKDLELADEADAIISVEKLVRFNRYLASLLNNFISFRDFYSRKDKAVFQAGTLLLDGRSCDLCLKVLDPGKHAKIAGLSNTYLAYCDCIRPASGEKMEIVAAFTGGDSDFLMVGRNGIFYDRQGRDWDAAITKVVDNPISVRQAFLAPYKKIGRFINAQIEKFAASKEKAVEVNASGAVTDAGKKVEAAPAASGAGQQAFDLGKFVGIFAAIGLALGAIGSAFAAVVTGFLKLVWWQMPLALAGIVLLISGPSMIIAWLKLRQRNLGPILDASGWAVNARATINIPFGGSLTSVAALPHGARRSLKDPYAPPKSNTVLVLLVFAAVAAAACWYFGLFNFA